MPKFMDSFSWLQLATICFLGAVSPGPSLALVISNTLAGGRTNGVATSIGHAIGIGCWAMLTAVGVAELVVDKTTVLSGLQLIGSLVLAYIGIRTMLAGDYISNQPRPDKSNRSPIVLKGAAQGLLLSLFNPKIAVFFIAIFSHFAKADNGWLETGLMAGTAAIIDGSWYVFVALMLTGSGLMKILEEMASIINKVSGALLALIALYLLVDTLRPLLLA
jgi:threonine/homoserine/homoserine lactone efflux protein